MVVQSHIPQIFSYCDRWCEQCPLTQRCAVGSGKPKTGDLSGALAHLLAPIAVAEPTLFDVDVPLPACSEHPLAVQSRAWTFAANDWLATCFPDQELPSPVDAIAWHAGTLCMKVGRAVGDFQDRGPVPVESDAYGSAKVATLSLGKILDVLTLWCATHQLDRQALTLLGGACDLIDAIEEEFPGHTDFERPGFDTGALGPPVLYGPRIWLL